MIVLGSLLITKTRQRSIREGAQWDIPSKHFTPRVLRRAHQGDLIWLREPFAVITPHRSVKQLAATIRGASPLGLKVPKYLKPYFHRCHLKFYLAKDMCRAESLACLEITEIGAARIGGVVHDQQVDAFLQARKAAA